MSFSNQINLLEKELKKDLPGKIFQDKMAPPGRESRYLLKPDSRLQQKAGILILLFPFQDKLHTVFIKRTENNGPHSGQISFPGGKFNSRDKDLEYTALRETTEELGVNSESIRLLGALTPLFIPVSNYDVFTFIGFMNKYTGFSIQTDEVQYAIIENIQELQKPDSLGILEINHSKYHIKTPCYKIKDTNIWGATAMILSEFLEVYGKVFNSGK